jgi:hypothetical protein
MLLVQSVCARQNVDGWQCSILLMHCVCVRECVCVCVMCACVRANQVLVYACVHANQVPYVLHVFVWMQIELSKSGTASG